MSQSYERIDYQIRPAKAVERKMMAQLFSRLSVFEALENYCYVGLGSVYFTDFAVFHTACGFKQMVSIEDESDPNIQKRFLFNAPVGCIKLHFDRTTAVLPRLDWSNRSIVWLDYDGAVSREILSDLTYLVSKVRSGSLVSLSINAERGEIRAQADLISKLERAIGRDKIPTTAFTAADVERGTYISVLYEVLTAEVTAAISRRNSGADRAGRVFAKQIFYYTYRDGALMLTLGWIILDAVDYPLAKYCRFESFKHAMPGKLPFNIALPKLTPAEMRVINRADAQESYENLSGLPVPKEHLNMYRKLERYWPMPSFSDLI